MAALTLFPLQFKRQDSVPIDIDVTFATTTERVAYLSSPRRYAGQIVADLEEEKFYGLNAAKDAWIELGAGGGGVPLWEEKRVTESTPEEIILEPFLVESFLTNNSYLSGLQPEIGNSSLDWVNADNYLYVVNQNYLTGLDNSAFSAYGTGVYGAGGSNDYGFPQSLAITFVFKNNSYSQPGATYHGVLLRITTGGTNFVFQIHRPSASVWSLTNGSTTAIAIDPVIGGTDYTATITIENGNQVFTVLGTTVTESVAFANSNTFNKLEVEVGYDSYLGPFSMIEVQDVPEYINGIVRDELVPDPSVPDAVNPNYTQVNAVVLEDHELIVETNPVISVSNVVSVRPRPSVQSEGILTTGAFNLSGTFPPPLTLFGSEVDKKGDIRITQSYIYYCFATYTDGASEIWVRLPFVSSGAANRWAQWPISSSIAAFYNIAPLSNNDVPLHDYTGAAVTGVIPSLGTMYAGSGFYGAYYRFTPDAPGFTINYLLSYTIYPLGPTSGTCAFRVKGGTADDYTSTTLFESVNSVVQIYDEPTPITISFNYIHANSANPFYLNVDMISGGDFSWSFSGHFTITELSRTSN